MFPSEDYYFLFKTLIKRFNRYFTKYFIKKRVNISISLLFLFYLQNWN